jgi:AraC-like DNA-binding protein
MNPVSQPSTGVATSMSHDFGEWTELMSSSFVPLSVSSSGRNAFSGRIRARSLADASIIELTATPQAIERAPSLIHDSDKPYFIVSMQLEGTGVMIQDGREALLTPGDMAIFDTNRAYTRTYDTAFRSIVFRLPQTFMDLRPEAISQLTATRFAGDAGHTALVVPFLTSLADNMDRLTGQSGMRFVRNAVDLVATLLHSELGSRIQNPVGSRVSLIREIDEYIERNLANPGLHPHGIAAAHYISVRHLHGLFQGRGCSVSSWIRSRRLDRCQRDLLDPILAGVPVATIASRWGFNDPAHFSRVFRQTYGQSPSDYRHVDSL